MGCQSIKHSSMRERLQNEKSKKKKVAPRVSMNIFPYRPLYYYGNRAKGQKTDISICRLTTKSMKFIIYPPSLPPLTPPPTQIPITTPTPSQQAVQQSASAVGADLYLCGSHNWHFQLHCKQLIDIHGFPGQQRSKQRVGCGVGVSVVRAVAGRSREIGQPCQGRAAVNEGRPAA